MSDTPGGRLLQRVGLSMFWNAALLPLIAIFNLGSALLIRRYFALDSGLYDVLLGLANTLVFWASVGIPDALTLFVPQLEERGSRRAVVTFLRRAAGVSLLLLGILLIPVAIFASRIAAAFELGDGVLFVYLAFGLALARTLNNLQVKSLQGLLEHRASNLLQLLLAVVTAVGLVVTALGRLQMAAVMLVMIGGTLLVLVPGARWIRGALRQVPQGPPPAREGDREFSPGVPTGRFSRFCLFMYGTNWLNYFVRPAFASPAIMAATGSRAMVAIFNVGYNLPYTAVALVIASFQGLYRPMFSRLIDDPERLRTGFAEVTKVQITLLLPAGAGLAILSADYIPLLFGEAFRPAVPITQLLSGLLFLETTLNLGTIILSIGHRYGEVYAAMALRVAAMPFFVLLAARGQLLAAAGAFGLGRLLSVLVGYWLCRRAYGVRFPLGFLARAAMPTAAMVAILALLRPFAGGTWWGAIGSTLLGVVVVVLAMRWFRVLSEREVELLQRAKIPGGDLLISLMAPASGHRSSRS